LRSPRHDDPEVALMLRVQAGDASAFAKLMELFRPRIFGRLLKVLGDRGEAEDLTQEVFLRLYRSRQRYVPTARLSTWLYHITVNAARNALRYRRRPVRLCYHPQDTDDDRGRVDPTAPSERLERRELAEAVRRALGGLLYRQRTALEMFQFQNRSYAEIARALSMTPEATKSLLYRARLQMRASLQELPLT
jgi:RNA polymerase sigma-70 factor (ECF subfamily)